MKKVFLLTSLLLICISQIFSQTYTKIDFSEKKHSLQLDLTHNFKANLERNIFEERLNYYFESKSLDLNLGLRNTREEIDFLINPKLFPFHIESENLKGKLGLSIIYNCNINYNQFTEHNIANLLELNLINSKKSYFNMTLGYFFKKSKISEIKEFFTDESALLQFKFGKIIHNIFDLSFTISSYDDFNYLIIFSPLYNFDAAYILNEKIKFGIKSQINMTDQFTTSPNIGKINLSLYTRIKF
jgi:hypothetical protein